MPHSLTLSPSPTGARRTRLVDVPLDRATSAAVPFGVYVHVPFCASRCGYCDFNTYTAGELGSAASPDSWYDAVRADLAHGVAALAAADQPVRPADTVFFGGGTPSLVGGDRLVGVLHAIRDTFGLAPGAEVTTECNPESVSPEFFATLHTGGFTRISLGMQSTAAHVLAVLDRAHTPGRAGEAIAEARAAGFAHLNLDLIYGTPGESDDDLLGSLDRVLDAGVDHVSAYGLIVEDGTALARRIRRGEVPEIDDDVLAARYELLDERLHTAGYSWYEVSNWARGENGACRHNLGYWLGGDWWGVGPGAHAHVGGVRFATAKHPASYAQAVSEGVLPAVDAELLGPEERFEELLMLRTRTARGLTGEDLRESPTRGAAEQRVLARAVADGLVREKRSEKGSEEFAEADRRWVLTPRGRLLADLVVRDLVLAAEAGKAGTNGKIEGSEEG